MVNKLPKVVVLIGCYNHEEFIIPCLESVLDQTYPNVDIYIADDCSRDRTQEVIRSYLDNHPGLNVTVTFNQTNKGIAGNYNALIESALKDLDVEYVIPFAGDDLMRKDKIELQLNALQAQPKVCLCYSNMQWFNSSTGKKIINHFNFIFKPELIIENIISEAVIPTPTLCIRREALDKIRYNNELRYINDYLFAVELAILGSGVTYIPESLVFYRKHGASIMDTRTFSGERRQASDIIKRKYGYDKAASKFSRTAEYDEVLECFYRNEYIVSFKRVLALLPTFFSSKKWFFRLLKLLFIIKNKLVKSIIGK
ncbi:glycosyltransferase [Vibrio ordalii]|uniref:glycosyltransferase n=1 Tax=Vibrio ordalii TaxID=28174 RepID=UPI0025754E63|nr:glycosyltransferase [Vibrio ordalii]MCS0350739.1 glycosyltransferase [Vibrio ordalii]